MKLVSLETSHVGRFNITKGKIYERLDILPAISFTIKMYGLKSVEHYLIIDDKNCKLWYNSELFKPLNDSREEKLKRICK